MTSTYLMKNNYKAEIMKSQYFFFERTIAHLNMTRMIRRNSMQNFLIPSPLMMIARVGANTRHHSNQHLAKLNKQFTL